MGYSGNVGNYNNNCYYRGYDNGYSGSTFVLIVVLFILLIIVGATFMRGQY
ncbi:YjcZ family sporulation protein [Lysinibacillus parviboronicapiens]|uniref:YjcZ family sporulation protein n=1 Tax=Lysinibacillus parviboronicapiens TaxID=436516 RepID=UPI000D3AAD62|nr:YjcZ family sporulation protein [Lysinibacillus parviboronicapiens]